MVKEAELKAYEEELEEAKRVKALFARKEEVEREALEKLHAQKLARERAAQQAKREEEEAEEMRRQYAAMEKVTVTDDGAKKETVMVTPTAPMITVTSDEGLSHSYPQRSFKPEQPKGPETVTLKASGETGGAVDHTLFACVSLALMGSIALVTVSKSWLRSPVAAPESHIELLTKSGGYVDLEEPEPVEASW